MTMKRFFLLLIFFVLLFSNFILSTDEFSVIGSKARVCILSYDTEFKKSMAEALIKDLNSRGISVITDNIRNIKKYSAADYDAVILLSGAMIFSPRSHAVKFIKTNNYSSNIIYVFTTSNDTSPYDSLLDKKKIDAVTSASTTEGDKEFDEVKNEIIERIMQILDK